MMYRFDAFELDTAKGELSAQGVARAVEPQVFALLVLLVENRERLVSRDEIIDEVWRGRIVSDAAIDSRIKSLRQALDDDGKRQRLVKTIPRKGFRFVAEVRTTPLPRVEASASPGTAAPVEPMARPSIAVLPFRHAAPQGMQAILAEALPQELIAELARLRWLFVTAHGSSCRLRGEGVDIGEIRRLLGVRYVLMGSLAMAGKRLTVNVELIDTRDGGLVWGDRFAACLGDVHRMREDIRSRVLAELDIHIPLHEAARARLTVSEDLDAWSAFHLGLQYMYRFKPVDSQRAARLFRRAIACDPGFARAHAGLSFTHFQSAFLRYTDDRNSQAALARRHAERAVELDALDPFVNFTMGRSYWLDGDLAGSLAWLERATTICPNYAQGIYARAWTETLAGRCETGRRHINLAMRLSPLDPLHYAMLGTRALTHMLKAEDAEAATWADRAARAPGAHVLIAKIAAAAYRLKGDAGRAEWWAADVRSRNPALSRKDFFRAFPMPPGSARTRVSGALARLGF